MSWAAHIRWSSGCLLNRYRQAARCKLHVIFMPQFSIVHIASSISTHDPALRRCQHRVKARFMHAAQSGHEITLTWRDSQLKPSLVVRGSIVSAIRSVRCVAAWG